MKPLNIGVEMAEKRARQFCAYQERSQQEVRRKLYSFGLYPHEVENLIGKLIEENFLNEERYAIALAGGKFRVKQWGRHKIQQALKQQQVSSWNIKHAMQQIDEREYRATFERLAEKKYNLLKNEGNIFAKKSKLQRYLLQKGFETDMINEYINKL